MPDSHVSRRILFVEDEAAIFEPFSRALLRNGFEPVVARTAAEAIRGLNWLTRHESGLGQPSIAYDTIGALALAVVVGEAARAVHRNETEGKVGVLCLAADEGLGIPSEALAQLFTASTRKVSTMSPV